MHKTIRFILIFPVTIEIAGGSMRTKLLQNLLVTYGCKRASVEVRRSAPEVGFGLEAAMGLRRVPGG